LNADEEHRRVALQRQLEESQAERFGDADIGAKVLPGQMPAGAQARKTDGAPFDENPIGVAPEDKTDKLETE
jgi:hypothetical protein